MKLYANAAAASYTGPNHTFAIILRYRGMAGEEIERKRERDQIDQNKGRDRELPGRSRFLRGSD